MKAFPVGYPLAHFPADGKMLVGAHVSCVGCAKAGRAHASLCAPYGMSMNHTLGPGFGLAVALALGGSATASPAICRGNQESMLVAELFFGRKIDDRIIVGETAWARFLAREITPRFPDGLTVFDAAGQWRDRKSGAVVRQPTKVVLIVFRDEADKHEHLNAIADAYKRRFKQQSVGIVIKPACASF